MQVLIIIAYILDTEYDDYTPVSAVHCLSAIFTVMAKKDKEKYPRHYWLEDYEVRINNCIIRFRNA